MFFFKISYLAIMEDEKIIMGKPIKTNPPYLIDGWFKNHSKKNIKRIKQTKE